MRMTTCKNGHYFDQEKHNACPYCANAADSDFQTKQTMMVGGDEEKTALYQSASEVVANNDDAKTSYYSPSSSESVVTESSRQKQDEPLLLSGWLTITSEQSRGRSYTLTFGMNNIGRSEDNHVAIQNSDSSISREKHATIIYDYANNLFYVKHGEGQFLTYLNEEILLDTKQLNPHDKIRIGATELIFVPLCGDAFRWEE